MEMTSTPSDMASSKAASMSTSGHPASAQQTLYAASRAPGTAPLAVPFASPYRLARRTGFPAAVDAVCVP
uniref:Uncharacterized protein n=1 Tax=Nymphaea colorata TaxID=210225 RepID=A0A5K0XGB3_9MAGN